jgi:hypothetical protein
MYQRSTMIAVACTVAVSGYFATNGLFAVRAQTRTAQNSAS